MSRRHVCLWRINCHQHRHICPSSLPRLPRRHVQQFYWRNCLQRDAAWLFRAHGHEPNFRSHSAHTVPARLLLQHDRRNGMQIVLPGHLCGWHSQHKLYSLRSKYICCLIRCVNVHSLLWRNPSGASGVSHVLKQSNVLRCRKVPANRPLLSMPSRCCLPWRQLVLYSVPVSPCGTRRN